MIGEPWSTMLVVLGGTSALMLALFFAHLPSRNANVVDLGWTIALASGGAYAAISGSGGLATRALLAALIVLWGLRLASHLLPRTLHEQEDGRYRALRRAVRSWELAAFLLMFQVQALVVGLLVIVFAVGGETQRAGLGPLQAAGALVWAFGLAFQSIGDAQLKRFKADPSNKGRVCDVGLWRYTRHPNFFGEFVMWIGYSIIAIEAPLGWLGLASPAIMLLLLLTVSGIPPTEAQSLRSRGEAYRDYQRRTSAFVPLPPKESA